MSAGVRSTNVNYRPALAKEFVVNGEQGTGLQDFKQLATQLAGSGAVYEAIEDVRNTAVRKWVPFDTKAEMDASLGYAADVEGRVYNDLGKGVYKKVGAAGTGSWAYQGPLPEADLTYVDQRAGNQLIFDGAIIEDMANLIGGGPSVYFTTYAYMAGALLATFPPNSSLTGRYRVAVTNTTQALTIYYDKQSGTVNTAIYPEEMPNDPARYFHMASFFGGNRGSAAGGNRIISTRDIRTRLITPTRPVVFDSAAGELRIPEIGGFAGNGTFFALQPVSNQDAYRIVTVPRAPAATPLQYVWVNVGDILANGSRSANALKVTGENDPPPGADGFVIRLATIFNEQVTLNADVGQLATVVSNQFGVGREDNDLAPFTYGAEAVDLESAELLALGFTRGWTAVEFGGAPYQAFYGDYFDNPVSSGNVILRLFIETSAANQFGSNYTFYIFDENGQPQNIYFRYLGQSRKLSNNVIEVEGFGIIPAAPGKRYIGGYFGCSHPAGGVVKLAGIQCSATQEAFPAISRKDYPRELETTGSRLRGLEMTSGDLEGVLQPVIPSVFYVMEERPYPIYFDQMFNQSDVSGRASLAITLAGGNPDRAPVPVIDMPQIGSAFLPLSRLGNTSSINIDVVDKKAGAGKRVGRTSTVKKITASQVDALSFSILTMGDSLSDVYGNATQAINRMVALGASVSATGTLQMAAFIAGETARAGEARSGKKLADMVNITNGLTPLPAGQEAAYLAMTEAQRRTYNPFLKVPNSSDTTNRADMIKNGYIYDLEFYLTRFGFTAPDAFMLYMVMNDLLQITSYSDGIAGVLEALRIIIAQNRRQFPNMKNIVVFPGLGRGTYDGGLQGDTHWKTKHIPAARAMQAYLSSLATPVPFFPGYCLVSRVSGFGVSQTSPDANGLVTRTNNDCVHTWQPGAMQIGEPLAQFIAGVMIG